MNFTTQIFIFIFFPLCLAVYWLVLLLEKKSPLSKILEAIRAEDLVLIAFSFGFYMWACFDDLFRFLVYIFIVYLFSCWIQNVKDKQQTLVIAQANNRNKTISTAAFPLAIGVLVFVLVLVWFKFFNFFTSMWNWLLKDTAPYKSIIAPLGISFITFSAISYLTDIYRGQARRGSLIDCALYLSFFPKVISGPIVMWKDFQGQIRARKPSVEDFTSGLNRIMIGFGKKVILADSFGTCLASIGNGSMDQLTAIGSILLYTMQTYYDFSGYSDIAIGISKLFGFQFAENFQAPYLSRSIAEFWRRWHISLGAWFRDYLYYPLMRSEALSGLMKGLAKSGNKRAARTVPTVIALFITWFTTGLWHGASWNYVVYGLFHGGFIILSVVLARIYKGAKTKLHIHENSVLWRGFQILRTFAIVNLGFTLFHSGGGGDTRQAVRLVAIAAGIKRCDTIYYTWKYFFDAQIVTFLGIGLLCSTVLASSWAKNKLKPCLETKIGFLVKELLIFGIFVLAIMFMVNQNYSPFIYFQY